MIVTSQDLDDVRCLLVAERDVREGQRGELRTRTYDFLKEWRRIRHLYLCKHPVPTPARYADECELGQPWEWRTGRVDDVQFDVFSEF